jgi:hypothetical protein
VSGSDGITPNPVFQIVWSGFDTNKHLQSHRPLCDLVPVLCFVSSGCGCGCAHSSSNIGTEAFHVGQGRYIQHRVSRILLLQGLDQFLFMGCHCMLLHPGIRCFLAPFPIHVLFQTIIFFLEILDRFFQFFCKGLFTKSTFMSMGTVSFTETIQRIKKIGSGSKNNLSDREPVLLFVFPPLPSLSGPSYLPLVYRHGRGITGIFPR